MRRQHGGRLAHSWVAVLLIFLPSARCSADGASLPFLEVETFPVPVNANVSPTLLAKLSSETGIAGTEIVGIRVKVGVVEGHQLDQLQLGIADGLFLVNSRGFLASAGQFLLRVLRFLLLGQLATAGSDLEIPAQSWSLLLGAKAADSPEMMNLYTRRELSVDGGDPNITNHGEFVVCRFLVAANRLSELVDVRIRTRDPRTQDWLSYRIPRVVLPLQNYGFQSGPQIGRGQRLGSADYVGHSSVFGGDEPLILAGYLRAIEPLWGSGGD